MTHEKAGELKREFTKRDIGIVIDESCGSVDELNARTIDFAREYGFQHDGLIHGVFCGLRGLEIAMTYNDAESASHSGDCSDAVEWLLQQPEIAAQLDAISAEQIREGLRDAGAWSEEELANDEANRLRAVWLAACDARENGSQELSEAADDAVDFLNGLDGVPYCLFYFEDNSLFYLPSVESVKEDVEFVSSREQAEPSTDYRGEWLHVNDHGNCTLYVRENGQDHEIWSV